MNSQQTTLTPQLEPVPPAMTSWDAHLHLDFAFRHQRTLLEKRAHKGPLVFQKVLYPEGASPAHGVIIHPPGGIAGGDRLHLVLKLSDQASTVLTTPGASKWYKSAGRRASQQVDITLAGNAMLEWLPQENIIFDQANVSLSTIVDLSVQAKFASWEIVSLGRKASGEKWQQGQFRQSLAIRRDHQLIWHDTAAFTADSILLDSIAGLRGKTVFGGLVIAAGQVPRDILEACRAITLPSSALYGVSALPEIFTVRYLGDCPQEARQYFETLWACLRPWYGNRPAHRPRIWAT